MKLADIILLEAIIPELRASDRDGVVCEMVTALAVSLKHGDDVAASVTEAVMLR